MRCLPLQSVTVEEVLAQLTEEVARLPPRGKAALFYLAGRALFPLYIEFERRSGRTNSPAVERALALARGFICGAEADLSEFMALSEELNRTAPWGDEFDPPLSTFAQDVTICVETSLRCALESDVDARGVYYVLEPALQTACEEDTGYLSDEKWYRRPIKNERLEAAVGCLARLVENLSNGAPLSRDQLESLEVGAEKLFWMARSWITDSN